MRVMCGCLKVSVQAYYAWVQRRLEREDGKASIRTAVREKFYFHRGRYGVKRLSGELKDEGVKAG